MNGRAWAKIVRTNFSEGIYSLYFCLQLKFKRLTKISTSKNDWCQMHREDEVNEVKK